MPTKKLRKGSPLAMGKQKHHRAHTPITSKAQRGLFGAELARRRVGKKRRMKGITTAELEGHLEESAGKKLPKRIKKGGRSS